MLVLERGKDSTEIDAFHKEPFYLLHRRTGTLWLHKAGRPIMGSHPSLPVDAWTCAGFKVPALGHCRRSTSCPGFHNPFAPDQGQKVYYIMPPMPVRTSSTTSPGSGMLQATALVVRNIDQHRRSVLQSRTGHLLGPQSTPSEVLVLAGRGVQTGTGKRGR